jgi:subtilisin family serine protease
MTRSAGSPDVVIGLIDGPVALDHEALGTNIRRLAGAETASCTHREGVACMHGTMVAGVLAARRGSAAPAICPECTILVRPIFGAAHAADRYVPSTTAEELAAAIVETVDGGARIINLSAALMPGGSPRGDRALNRALDLAAARGVITVAAAGNDATIGGSAIVRHPLVIPVAGCDGIGRPLPESNLGHSIGRRGLSAPGEGVTSLAVGGGTRTFGGTSAATPFVSGAAGQLWSCYPAATAAQLRWALTLALGAQRRTVVPPLLDASASLRALSAIVDSR